MKKLLNTLYVTSEDGYATLDGENVVVRDKTKIIGRFPLHILKSIYIFSYSGASPALMEKCAVSGIDLVFFSPRGHFLARTSGFENGNVLLREKQYEILHSDESLYIVRNMEFGKIYNARQTINRTRRDHYERVNTYEFDSVSSQLKNLALRVRQAATMQNVRGLEGSAAALYFGLFDQMILTSKEAFYFHGRNRRPPLDNVNCLLSYAYTYLALDCASGLEAAGLDPYVGFLHTLRPGRKSLAIDLMEEFRCCFADRFVLTLINNRIIEQKDFYQEESGAVLMTDSGKRIFNQEWQKRKNVIIEHPYIHEKVEWGLLPYVQSLLLARYIRGDLDEYAPFLWR